MKVPSTPDAPSPGLVAALARAGVALPELELIVHGATIATIAVSSEGARCALVTSDRRKEQA